MNFTSTKKTTKHVKVLVYGRSGVGKTRLCATCPKPIIISTESGLLSLADYDIPVIEVETLEDFQDAYDIVAGKKGKKFDTVCLDSVTDIADSILADIQESTRDGRQAYGELNKEILKLLRKFRGLKKHVYFIAQSEKYENEYGLTAYQPSMPGRTLTQKLPFMFDELFAYRHKGDEDGETDGKRYLLTNETPAWEAKDRSGKLKTKEKPHLGKIFQKIIGGKE